jgi:predicted transcriptional regulator
MRHAARDQFALIADSTRRRILECLGAGESDVSGLIEALALPQPLVSKHLRALRSALCPRRTSQRSRSGFIRPRLVAIVPEAFHHPVEGYVGLHIMYRRL